jgi:hypothetical protein
MDTFGENFTFFVKIESLKDRVLSKLIFYPGMKFGSLLLSLTFVYFYLFIYLLQFFVLVLHLNFKHKTPVILQ